MSFFKFNFNKFLFPALAIEAVTVLLAAFGFLPSQFLLYLTLAMILFMALLSPIKALSFFILSLPWFVAVPWGESVRLQNWRILAVELFIIILWQNRQQFIQALHQGLKGIINFFKLSKIDFAFFLFLAVCLISLLDAQFKEVGLRYVVWLINTYLIFIVARLVARGDEEKGEILKSSVISALVLVAAGFIQFLVFLRLPVDFFWQYWTNTVISTFYGTDLAQITSQFNSWFCYESLKPVGLRMFSFFPGSHYFAFFGILSLPFIFKWREAGHKKKLRGLWLVLLLLAIILSGVRGAWLSILAPLFLVLVFLFFKKISKFEFKKQIFPLILFIALFAAMPLFQTVFTSVSVSDQGGCGLWSRAASSADLAETSNAKRLALWKTSWKSFEQNPILGLGVGNFSLVFGDPGPSRGFNEVMNENDPIIGIPKKYLSAHNLYLNILVETGALGLLAFLFFLSVIFYTIWHQGLTGFKLAFGLALVWLLAYSMFDVVFIYNDKSQIFFWLVLSLLFHEPKDQE